jgi:hypothetical protein
MSARGSREHGPQVGRGALMGESVMKKPSRRAVVRTGVWAVPVVATAAAAPAFAGTSTPCPVTVDAVGAACKLPGSSTDVRKGYRMLLTFHNSSQSAQAITVTSFTISGAPTTQFTPKSFMVPPGTSTKVFIVQSTTSSQRAATVSYVVASQSTSVVVDFGSFNPCKCTPKGADPTDPNSDCS